MYAYYTCPFYTDQCGNSDIISLTATGATQAISASPAAGQVCFYDVSAANGAAGF
jgi:hypothetical protein